MKLQLSLNPYYNGKYSMSYLHGVFVPVGMSVLILIIMENTL